MAQQPAIPLSGWADRQIRLLGQATNSPQISALSGAGLLGERAVLNGFHVPGLISAGRGCRLYQTRDGWLALSLARPDDRELLPALFGTADLDFEDDQAIASKMLSTDAHTLAAKGAELGLAIAAEAEVPESPASEIIATGQQKQREANERPMVIDLSALWAGPLATHLLKLAGAEILKIESPARPDTTRTGDPALFNLLNQHKASVALDLRLSEDRNALLTLIRRADIVVESSRPRALLQLGIDPDTLVAELPGLVWISITGHGVRGTASNRVGFGDDCGVAGGLSAALRHATGMPGFVGDAIADPLTGIAAARLAWAQWQSGHAARVMASMSSVIAAALAEERALNGAGLDDDLRAWAAAEGQPFPSAPLRDFGAASPFGADTAFWTQQASSC